MNEITFWAGQKLATYQVSTDGSGMYFTLTSTNVYFGGKLISKGSYSTSWNDHVALAPIAADRLGSIGKFYPYGTERPSATANDKEKFTGYFRDASTGLDYADQRYEQSGTGRFMSPDPYWGSTKAANPGSWNRYAYVQGDPINRKDPSGLYIQVFPWDDYNPGDDDPGEYMHSCADSVFLCYGFVPFVDNSPQGGGGGPADPPPPPPPQNRELLSAAVDQAIKDLMKPGCGDAIFLKGSDPAWVLQQLVQGGSLGKITFADLGSGVGGDEYQNRFLGLFRRHSVTIEINTYNDPSRIYWNAGDVNVNAITLIHELAHAFIDLFGKGSSTFEKDTDFTGKDRNAEDRNIHRTDPCKN